MSLSKSTTESNENSSSLREANTLTEAIVMSENITKSIGTDYTYKHKIVWRNAILFLLLHIICATGTVLMFFGYFKWQSTIWCKYFLIKLFTINNNCIFLLLGSCGIFNYKFIY